LCHNAKKKKNGEEVGATGRQVERKVGSRLTFNKTGQKGVAGRNATNAAQKKKRKRDRQKKETQPHTKSGGEKTQQ